MRVERDDHFVCEAGHPLYRYFFGRSDGHMLLCKSCDADQIHDLQAEERMVEKAVRHLISSNERSQATAPASPTSETYGSADGYRALLACGAAKDTADDLAIVVADEANAAVRTSKIGHAPTCRSDDRRSDR